MTTITQLIQKKNRIFSELILNSADKKGLIIRKENKTTI